MKRIHMELPDVVRRRGILGNRGGGGTGTNVPLD